MAEAMTQVDQTDPLLAAKMFESAYPDRTNDYYCPGMGDSGIGKLMTVKSSQKKGAGTQNMREDLVRFQQESEVLRSEVRRLAERTRRQSSISGR